MSVRWVRGDLGGGERDSVCQLGRRLFGANPGGKGFPRNELCPEVGVKQSLQLWWFFPVGKSHLLIAFSAAGVGTLFRPKNSPNPWNPRCFFFSLVKLCQQNTKRIFKIQLRMDRVVGLPNHFPYDPGWFTLYPDNYVQLRKKETRIKEN